MLCTDYRAHPFRLFLSLFLFLATFSQPVSVRSQSQSQSQSQSEPEPAFPSADSLTLKEALERAFSRNPDLRGLEAEVEGRSALARQAAALPNPEVQVSAENFAGGGPFRGTRALETTVEVGQTLELGAKRSKRRALATAELDQARVELEARKREVEAEVRRAFVALWLAQEKARVYELARRNQAEALDAARARLRVGKAPETELLREEIALSLLAAEMRNSEGARRTASIRLQSLWSAGNEVGDLGNTPVMDTLVTVKLDSAEGSGDAHRFFSREIMNTASSRHPEMLRRLKEMERARRSLELARAASLPDLRISAGVRHHQAEGSPAAVAALSLPLPVFNRNTGAVQAADRLLARAGAERGAAEASLRARIASLYQEAETQARNFEGLEKETLPQAERAYAKSLEGHRLGRFNYLEALDVQRTWIETRMRLLEARAAHLQAVGELEAFIGNHTASEKKGKFQ